MARRNRYGSKRPRRVYIYRKGRRMGRTKKIGLFNILGIGIGMGLSGFGPNGSDFQYFKSDPAGQSKYVANGIIAGVTGYNMISKDWNAGNLIEFWGPVAGFFILDKVAKKMGFGNLKIFRNIRGA